ncbi:glycosyltransferase [Gorillibacterium timonense]|uniref:glycosyltransferase n=1 Tax=Gorillibacterium timonense TaxID=1689269 RepID=UPI00071DB30B|nr:glycosyltransferase [Gorillibacterium timonense]
MKKKLLFIMNNLGCGGAEKSLVSLLDTIDYDAYEVDLLLFRQEGLFLNQIPEPVKVLPEPGGYRYYDMPLAQAVAANLSRGRIRAAASRVQAAYLFRSEKNRARCEQRVWRHLSRSLPPLAGEYDAAIGFLEKNPIYYCIEKVKAKKKLGFIHIDYNKLGMDAKLDQPFFERLDHLVTVSEECAETLRREFPDLSDKVEVIYNIVSPKAIRKLANEPVSLPPASVRLLSIGRLNAQKGFDLAVEACRRLVDSGKDISWAIIGEGEERPELERLIRHYGLEQRFFLMGMSENPYPYLKEADIYVQPSRFEGKSIAIDEAKILGKPIVVTNFSTARDQIESGETGLIVEMNAEALAEGIRLLMEDEGLCSSFSHRLAGLPLGTESEVYKLYQIIGQGESA